MEEIKPIPAGHGSIKCIFKSMWNKVYKSRKEMFNSSILVLSELVVDENTFRWMKSLNS